MASTLVKINIHLVFHVKSSGVKIRETDLDKMFAYIGSIIRSMGEMPITIGGMPDHIHILTSLPKTEALSDFVRKIKAESSKWIRMQDVHYNNFAWQEGYGAFSVSPTLIAKTSQYIRGQAEHHKKRTFQEEYRLFLEAYGIEYDARYAFSD